MRLAYSLMAALVTSVCDAAMAADASLIVEKEFAVCTSFSNYSATVSGAAGRNGRSCPVHQSLKYPHRGTNRLMVLSALHLTMLQAIAAAAAQCLHADCRRAP